MRYPVFCLLAPAANSEDVLVCQLKALFAAGLPHLVEARGGERSEIPSTKICALFVRDPAKETR